MYFPYLRGRQYELLALYDLIDKKLIGKKVIPIIEPVKLLPTLTKTMEIFVKNKCYLALICNPSVGIFESELKESSKNTVKEKYLSLLNNKYIIKSFLYNDSFSEIIKRDEYKIINKEDLLIINKERSCLEKYSKDFSKCNPRYVLIPDESAFRRRIKKNRILLDDKFLKKERNSEYIKKTDEFFSDDFFYFDSDGYIGISDYSITGSDYLETGFLPLAVVIHIVYLAKNKESLHIKHFVSDSNGDIHNPALKFYEAVKKLNGWCEKEKTEETIGLATLQEHYKKKTYPGLGSVKKLSIMHHLELMEKLMGGNSLR